jgi:hypothetical protein
MPTPAGVDESMSVEREYQYQFLIDAFDIKSKREIETVIHPLVQINSISNVIFTRFPLIETSSANVQSFTTKSNETEVLASIQNIITDISVTRESLEVLVIPPPSGVVDGYIESISLTNPILTRLNSFVTTDNPNTVTKRDGTVLTISNISTVSSDYVGQYTTTNAGPTLKNFDQIIDDGFADVSGLNLLQLDFYYPTLTISDFVDRGHSSYTKSGIYFNIANASIQNPVAINQTIGSITSGSSITVNSTTYFPDSGHLFTSTGALISYSSKTATTFNGCTLISGSSLINTGDEFIPFSIN